MSRNGFILGALVAVAAVIAFLIFRDGKAPGPQTENDDKQWFKGNTHTHSLWSDGNDFPEMIVAWYHERDYDFLALSDHNILSRSEKWMAVTQIEKRRRDRKTGTLDKYLTKFGEDWVELRGEEDKREVRLKTLEEIRPRFEEDGNFLLIEAEEITDKFRNKHVHINAINLDEVIPPQGGGSVVEVMRNNLHMVQEQSERLERPILAHVNHPNFHWSVSPQDLAEVVEEKFFEVYNGHPGINHLGNEDNPGDQVIWDMANTLRLVLHKAPPLFGIATDDSHTYHGGDVSPGRGWIMVRATELSAAQLIPAMEDGDFYASTGVMLNEVVFDERRKELRLNIRSSSADVEFETSFVGTRRDTPENPGEVLASISGPDPSYRLTGDELYVRAVVTSTNPHPNPSYQGQREQAWTQPVGWRIPE